MMMRQTTQNATLVFKIATATQWASAVETGAFAGSIDDLRDGFIHLSAGDQLSGTLAKHFRGQSDLVLIAFTALSLAPELKWEVSRGGDLFPHLYAPLAAIHALWVKPLTLDAEGIPQVPEDLG
jgi:uncharacterized protein (DUF952 family)